MTIALWVIAICEIVRAAQNMAQIAIVRHDAKNRDNAYAEFVRSLKHDDSEFVRRLLEEFEKDKRRKG